MMRWLVAWVRSVAAYVFLCLYVALVGPFALLVSFLTGWVAHFFELGYLASKTARHIAGVRLSVEGLDRVAGDRPTVYCINHRSYLDAPVAFESLFRRCPKLRGIYKAEMGKLPIFGTALRVSGFVPIVRDNPGRAFEAVELAVSRLRQGYSFLLAPEGTRATAKDMRPFKKGAFVMAIKAQVPVAPVAIIGSGEAMPRGRLYVTPERITVKVGEPIPTTGLTLEDRDELAARVRLALEQLLDRDEFHSGDEQ
jgi:1-acyl-sn-glycerol-3-phosphate acyltransferase